MPKLLGDWGGILGLRVVITKDSDTGLEAVTIAVTDVKHICCLERKKPQNPQNKLWVQLSGKQPPNLLFLPDCEV